jgi:dTDP-4-dehydrorhamnose 3,5-epimerase/reductase
MDPSKFLIIGANGQLGKALQAQYPQARAVDSAELDISSQEAIAKFDWSGISCILNAAAYTNVDGAETDDGRRAAWAVNATAVSNLATIADEHDMMLIHVSTDYVFDGSQSVHVEEEQLSPLSTYGASKAAGDIAAASVHKHYILRSSWIIGDGKNFVRTMTELAGRDISPTVVHDQIGRLTFTSELVKAIDHLMTSGSDYGVYNVTNDGDPVSWADITRTIYQLLGRDDLTVTNTTTAEYFAGKDIFAVRPLQSTLDLTKVKSAGFAPSDWKSDLERYVKGGNS